MVQTIPFADHANTPFANLCPAKSLAPDQRQQLAVHALAGSFTITALADQADVSRKFVYHQVSIAQHALDLAFATPPANLDTDHILFHIPVTKRWLWQVVLVLLLVCRSSYRGVIDFFRICFDYPISLGTIHNIAYDAVEQARAHNTTQRLEGVRFGIPDEIFQAGVPILVGIDAYSTYCYLLSQEECRDGDTWGVRLLELQDRGFNPQANIADFGSGLRAGHAEALPNTPCRGDVFHALQTVTPVVTALENAAYEAMSLRDSLERKATKHENRHGRADRGLAQKLARAKRAEAQAIALAEDIALLARWLHYDLFAVAGPCYTERMALCDFIVAELKTRVPLCPHRLKPLCTFLKNHQGELLAFVQELDQDLAALASDFQVGVESLRELLLLQTMSHTHPQRQHRQGVLRQRLRDRFYVLNEAVRELAERTVRASSAVENLNSRLRNYFTLRRHLGSDYLTLLQFFLNHNRLARSERPERVGKSPAELLTGQAHPHWLEMLGYTLFSRN
jgi:hypothetical protein